MVFNAIVQSAQPIISFNYGCGQMPRSNKALRMAMGAGVVFGIFITFVFTWFSGSIVSLFVPDSSNISWQYATQGLPLFAVDYIFFGINIITIGYYTSIERIKRAMNLTILRGVLPVIFFFTLPLWFNIPGIWLSVAAGDITTTIIIVFLRLKDKMHNNGNATHADKQILQTQ